MSEGPQPIPDGGHFCFSGMVYYHQVMQRGDEFMVKALTAEKRPAKQKSSAAALPRVREADEFEADTQEDRPIALLAERRREFLAKLQAQNTGPMEE